MMLGVQFLHALARHMGIDLGCGQIAVAQQHLYDPEVGTMVQQVRGKSVAEGMWRKVLLDPRLLRVPLDDVPEGLAGHTVAATGRKEVLGLAFKQDFVPGTPRELAEPAD